MKIHIYLIPLIVVLASCKKEQKSDAYGNFETREIIVSSESNGKLLIFDAMEGTKIKKGETIGLTDTVQLYLQKLQLIAQKKAISTKKSNVDGQIQVLEEQRKTLKKEISRMEKMFSEDAVPEQQLDNLQGQLNVVESQIRSTSVQNNSIQAEMNVLDKQIDLLDYQIGKCKIQNPVDGIILTKYCEQGEFVNTGKPLYKIADLDMMYLKAYISGNQLSKVKIGQEVEVLFDGTNDISTTKGKIIWISDQSEFTPKIIQTRDERVNLVYAIKVEVNNKEGQIKIGMPGEISF